MEEAAIIFGEPCITFSDLRKDYNETRLITIGLLRSRMVVLVWTWRTKVGRQNVRRIISIRKANEREQELYQNRLD